MGNLETMCGVDLEMNHCILCGEIAFSDLDNACKKCIEDLAKLDADTLPNWLFFINVKRSANFIKEIMRE